MELVGVIMYNLEDFEGRSFLKYNDFSALTVVLGIQAPERRFEMDDMLNDIIDRIYEGEPFDAKTLERELAEWGFMIVPIEDPTNLFGVMEDNV